MQAVWQNDFYFERLHHREKYPFGKRSRILYEYCFYKTSFDNYSLHQKP